MVKTMGDDGGSIWQSRSKHIVTLLPLWLINVFFSQRLSLWCHIFETKYKIIPKIDDTKSRYDLTSAAKSDIDQINNNL